MLPLAKTWLEFWVAAGRRDGQALRKPALALLKNPAIKSRRNGSIALIGALVADLVTGRPGDALKRWEQFKKPVLRGAEVPMVIRILLSHAQRARRG